MNNWILVKNELTPSSLSLNHRMTLTLPLHEGNSNHWTMATTSIFKCIGTNGRNKPNVSRDPRERSVPDQLLQSTPPYWKFLEFRSADTKSDVSSSPTMLTNIKLTVLNFQFDFNFNMAKKKLSVGHINIAKKSAAIDVINRASELNYDLVLLNEPPKRLKTDLPTGYKLITATDDPMTAVIVVNNKLTITPLTVSKFLIIIKVEHVNINIICVYRPHSNRQAINDLMEWINEIVNDNCDRYILMGDVNARHESLGSEKTCQYGKRLMDMFEPMMWTVINEPGTPTFKGGCGLPSIIDWTAVTQDMVQRATWQIDTDPIFDVSDHFFCKLTIRLTSTIQCSETRQHLPIGAFINMALQKDILADCSSAYDKLLECSILCRRESKHRPIPKDFYNQIQAIRGMRNRTTRALRRMGNSASLDMKIYAKKLQNLLSSKIGAILNRQRKDKYSGMDANTAYKTILNEVKKKYHDKVSCLVINNRVITDEVTIASEALNHFYPVQLPEPIVHTIGGEEDPPITAFEVTSALMKARQKSAPGDDLINIDVLKTMMHRSPQLITSIYNHYLNVGTIPENLKSSRIVLLKKKALGPNCLNNLRPIGLQSKFLKTLESVVIRRLTHFINSNVPLNDAQYGFTQGKSTLNAANKLKQLRKMNADAGRKELLLSIDIKGAYDNLNNQSIIDALIQREVPDNLVQLIVSLFSSRTAFINTTNGKVSKRVTNGLTQGSVVGPLLFNITLDGVLDRLINLHAADGMDLIAYADDIMLLIHGWTDRQDLQMKVTTILNTLSSLLRDIGLEISPLKTQAMITSINNQQITMTLDILGTEITTRRTCKLWGLILEHDRSFSAHVYELNNKLKELRKTYKKILDRGENLPQGTRGQVTRSKLHSPYIYLCPIWFDEENPLHKEKVLPAIMAASRTVASIQMDLYGSTPYSACMVLGEIDCLLHQLISLSMAQRQLLNQLHSKTKRPIATKSPNYLRIHPAHHVPITLDCSSNGQLTTDGISYIVLTDSRIAQMYGTSRCASGYIAISRIDEDRHIESFRTDDNTSFYQLGILAIKKACRYIETNHVRGKHLILTNNNSILNAIENVNNMESSICELRNLIIDLHNQGIKITLVKTDNKSHSVDARSLSELLFITLNRPDIEITGLPISIGTVKREAKKVADDEVDKIYRSRNYSTIHKFFPSLADARKARDAMDPFTCLIFSGHCPTNEYRAKIYKEDPKCRCGAAVQTLEHVIVECPLFSQVTARAKQTTKFNQRITVDGTNIWSSKEAIKLISMIAKPLYYKLKSVNYGINYDEDGIPQTRFYQTPIVFRRRQLLPTTRMLNWLSM